MSYVCSSCNKDYDEYFMQCQNCGEWDTCSSSGVSTSVPGKLRRTTSYKKKNHSRIKTIQPIDYITGGGLVVGFTYLMYGPPGLGKSTLVGQLSGGCAKNDGTVAYIIRAFFTCDIGNRSTILGTTT